MGSLIKAEPRVPTPEDAPELVRLGGLMYEAMGIPPTDAWAERSRERVARRLGIDLFGFVIDAGSGRLAACALLNAQPRLPRPGVEAERCGYIQWVSTDPEFRRRGFARALTTLLLDLASDRGIEVVELHATPDGRSLYDELGFSTDGVGEGMRITLSRA